LNECVADAVNIITCETHPVGGAITWSGHSRAESAGGGGGGGAEGGVYR
jgi:hypothetical protein